MARIRTIKPEFWSDRKLAKDLSRDQRLFYIALWNEADDEGRFLANTRRLLGIVFPFDGDLTESFIEDSLRALADTERLVLYDVDGTPYGELTKFDDHQRINRPTPSRIPGPDNELANIHGGLSDDSVSPQCPEVGTGEQGNRGVLGSPDGDLSKSAVPITDMWEVFIEELGGERPPYPRLTKKRRAKLAALYEEHLSASDEPVETFRSVLKCVQQSDHHMQVRSYQMPESLFRNEERRDNWIQRAHGSNGKPKHWASEL